MSRSQTDRLSEARRDMALFRTPSRVGGREEDFVNTVPAMAVTGLQAILGDEHDELPSDRDFIAMLAAYRATGGIARTDDLARMLNEQRSAGLDGLAGLISAGTVFGFEWRSEFWLPMFQFVPHDLTIKPAPQQVVAELTDEFDGWALAVWFSQPNSWLKCRRPVNLLDTQLTQVLEAARADRFIAAG